MLIALGSLTVWHARLISKGETSIEANINKAETKRLAEKNKVIVFYPYHIVKCVCKLLPVSLSFLYSEVEPYLLLLKKMFTVVYWHEVWIQHTMLAEIKSFRI